MFVVRDFPPGAWPSPSACVPLCPPTYPPANQCSDRHLVTYLPENHPEKVLVQLVPHVVHPEAQGLDAPPPLSGVNTSSSLEIRCPGDNRKVRHGFRTAVFHAASLSAGLSITGGRSLPVCRRRAPCMVSVGNSQSSRWVFDKVCSSRISEIGISGTFLYLSSSSVGVLNSTLPSSDSITSSVSCCNMFLNHRENFSSLCAPLVPLKLNPGHGHQNVADPSRGRRNRDNSWLQFNGFIQSTEAPPLLHIHKA